MPKPVVRLTVDLSPCYAKALAILQVVPAGTVTKRDVVEQAIFEAMNANGYERCEGCEDWLRIADSTWRDSEGVVLCPKCAEDEK